MRVLQIIQKPQLRGAEIFACQLSSQLKSKEIVVDVVYLFDGSPEITERFSDLKFMSLGAQRSRRFFDVGAYYRLFKIITKGKYTIVQANAGDTLKYAAFSKFLFRWKAVLIFRNANKMSSFIKNRLHQHLVKFFLRRCNYIVSVSENCRADICSLYPAALNNAVTIPIGTFDFENVTVVKRNTHEPILINIGSLVAEKNHIFLLAIFAAFFNKHKKGFLWLVGGGPQLGALKARVDELGLSERVTFYGFSDNAISLLKAADILVMPSKIEGLPGVILESFSCGVPVIASDVGGISEVVRDQVTGICIGEYSVDKFVDSIELILSDETFQKKISINAQTLIQNEYNMRLITSRFKKFYEGVE